MGINFNKPICNVKIQGVAEKTHENRIMFGIFLYFKAKLSEIIRE